MLSRVWFFATPWTVAHQTPLSIELFRQEHVWVAISSSRGPSRPRDQTRVPYVSRIGWQILYHQRCRWAFCFAAPSSASQCGAFFLALLSFVVTLSLWVVLPRTMALITIQSLTYNCNCVPLQLLTEGSLCVSGNKNNQSWGKVWGNFWVNYLLPGALKLFFLFLALGLNDNLFWMVKTVETC